MKQEYRVIQEFKATEPISGREREFQVGDTILYAFGQTGTTITIEVEWSLYLVERLVFKTCCRFKNDGGSGY